jgi:hypothetical protein
LNGTHPINRPLIKLRISFELRNEVLLCYSDFNKPVLFHVYPDASDNQLGPIIMKDRMPISFHLLKIKAAKKRYITTD